MRWIDVAIVVVIALFALSGLLRGLIVQVAAIAGAIAALFLARYKYGAVEDFLAHFFHRNQHLAAASFLLIFVVVWLVITVAAHVLRALLRFSPLGLADRLGGLLFGAIQGAVLVEVLLILATRSKDPSLVASVHASHLAHLFRELVPGLNTLIPSHFPRTKLP